MGFIDSEDDISVEIPGMPAFSAARTIVARILETAELDIDEGLRDVFFAYWENYNENEFAHTDPRRAYADAKIFAAAFRELGMIFTEWAVDQENIAKDIDKTL